MDTEPTLLIRPRQSMPSTSTGRTGGIFVHVGREKDAEGRWINTRPLEHVTLSGKKGKPLDHHSPDGFEIGYGGSGPSDLALAICALLGKRNLYMDFKFKFLARLDRTDYDIPISHIAAMLERIARGEPISFFDPK